MIAIRQRLAVEICFEHRTLAEIFLEHNFGEILIFLPSYDIIMANFAWPPHFSLKYKNYARASSAWQYCFYGEPILALVTLKRIIS